MTRAIVLFSGGQDSTTCLALARLLFDEVIALSIFYGQRHRAELEAATEIATMFGVEHVLLDAPVVSTIGGSALVDATAPLTTDGGTPDIEMPQGLPSSFVPGRNALFFTLAAMVAAKRGARDIISGVCQTDFSGYPDCRRTFVDSTEKMLTEAMPSSIGPIRITTPLMWMTKAETVHLARRLPGCWEALARSITCYNGERPGCGKCAACDLRSRGFIEANEADPAT